MAPTPHAGRLRRYTVAMIMVVAFLSYVDRQIITILIQSIKADLGLSDTQIGMLTGVFFSFFYMAAGVPLARISDRGNRRSLIAACVGFWSAMTMFCGMVGSYVQLAIGRMLVATGEAGSAPASYSMLADLFPPQQRTRVIALMSCGSAFGIAFGIYLGGTLNEVLGWRATFLIVGAPGILVALLFWLSVPEPARPDAGGGAAPPQPLIASMLSFLGLKTYRALIFIAILASISAFAMLSWMPAFLIRVHGMSTADVGLKMGTALALGLLLGNLCCGTMADKLGARDPRWLIWTTGIGLLACVPTGLLSLGWPGTDGAIGWYGLFTFFLGFWAPPVISIVMGLVVPRSRALAASTIPILQSVGGALGPLAVGMMSDALAPDHGVVALRYAMAVSLVGCLLGGIAALLGGRLLVREYRVPPS
ncbi:spinster family MFS transporter [Niveispirillum sp. KHB5.9]|uniref:spinster family MFS transporter n=1 Tax=Niveispirillum sp. KHB5.9 TaxID=3400269 RepID=UPI003A86C048